MSGSFSSLGSLAGSSAPSNSTNGENMELRCSSDMSLYQLSPTVYDAFGCVPKSERKAQA